ncbi:MAG: hypothetical protein JNK48_05465 [Bryobacterales bacterium]|nr:hypothetical protein [Bryobacterales bacterium]
MSLAESFADFEVATRQAFAQTEHALTNRLAELSAKLAKELERRDRAQSERLNQLARRLRMAESVEEWKTILEEGASAYASRVAVFAAGEVAEAPAFAMAMETRDTVITMRTAAELGEEAAARLGEALSPRCYLVPVFHGETVCAVLYAEDKVKPPREALELVAMLAAQTMPVPVAAPPAAEPEPVPEAEAVAGPVLIQIAPAEKSYERQVLETKAKNFARREVARLLLFEQPAVDSGRRNASLYVQLKEPIDSGRERYRQEFLLAAPSMSDYLHEELVRTLANDDPSKLGSEYPGALR